MCSFYNSGSNKTLRALSEIFSYYFILTVPKFSQKVSVSLNILIYFVFKIRGTKKSLKKFR